MRCRGRGWRREGEWDGMGGFGDVSQMSLRRIEE